MLFSLFEGEKLRFCILKEKKEKKNDAVFFLGGLFLVAALVETERSGSGLKSRHLAMRNRV